ncbi:MAG TPA: hypothetical protein VIR27_05255 [Mycobacteriales bacterium]
MHHLIAARVLAAGPVINTTGVIAWIVKFVVPLLFAMAAVVVMSRAHQGRTRENAVVAVNLFLGIFLLAAGGVLFAFGQQLVDLVFS